MKSKYQEQLEILSEKLKSSQEQVLMAQESARFLEEEISLLNKNIDLEIINSSEFFEEIKKFEFKLHLDWGNPRLVHEFCETEKFPFTFNKVKHRLSSRMKDNQIYKRENVYFDCLYRNEFRICSSSIKDLMIFAKNHNLKWYDKSINLLNEEISEVKTQLNDLNKFKRLMEKYK